MITQQAASPEKLVAMRPRIALTSQNVRPSLTTNIKPLGRSLIRATFLNIAIYLIPLCVALAALCNMATYVLSVSWLVHLILPVSVLCGLAGTLYNIDRVSILSVSTGLFLVSATVSMMEQNRSYSTVMVLFNQLVAIQSVLGLSAGYMLGRIGRPRVYAAITVIAPVAMALAAALVVWELRHIKNIIGGLMLPLAVVGLAAQLLRKGRVTAKETLLASALIIVGSHLANHRMMEVVGVIFAAASLIMMRFKSPVWRLVFPLLAVAGGVLLIYVIANFDSLEFMAEMNRQAIAQTGRSLRSGREAFWGTVLSAMHAAPLFGYGPATVAEEFTGIDLSAHNAFLQIGLRYGVVGLSLLLVMMLLIGWRAIRAVNVDAGALLSAYLTCVIVHNSTENVLLFGDPPITFLTWLNLGILIYCCERDVASDLAGHTSSISNILARRTLDRGRTPIEVRGAARSPLLPARRGNG